MDWCVSSAWRVFWSEVKVYRSRQLMIGIHVHVDEGQFLGKGSVRLWSELKESITRLPHRLLSGRRAVYCRPGLKWEYTGVGIKGENQQ
jgi:hypothetical protein